MLRKSNVAMSKTNLWPCFLWYILSAVEFWDQRNRILDVGRCIVPILNCCNLYRRRDSDRIVNILILLIKVNGS